METGDGHGFTRHHFSSLLLVTRISSLLGCGPLLAAAALHRAVDDAAAVHAAAVLRGAGGKGNAIAAHAAFDRGFRAAGGKGPGKHLEFLLELELSVAD